MDIGEVIAAATTKLFGFMPVLPGSTRASVVTAFPSSRSLPSLVEFQGAGLEARFIDPAEETNGPMLCLIIWSN